MLSKHMLQVYDGDFISLDKQYLTTGVNGVIEGAEFLGIEINDNEQYQKYIESILEPMYRADKEDKTWDNITEVLEVINAKGNCKYFNDISTCD